MRRVKNIFKGNAGFTLIELLIVIVIIGILAAVAIPNIIGLTSTANRGAVESEMRTVGTEVEAIRAKTGSYPADNDGDLTGLSSYQKLDGYVADEVGTFTYTKTGNSFEMVFAFANNDDFGPDLYYTPSTGLITTP